MQKQKSRSGTACTCGACGVHVGRHVAQPACSDRVEQRCTGAAAKDAPAAPAGLEVRPRCLITSSPLGMCLRALQTSVIMQNLLMIESHSRMTGRCGLPPRPAPPVPGSCPRPPLLGTLCTRGPGVHEAHVACSV